MAALQITGRDHGGPAGRSERVLTQATRAPSVFNAQPWKWRIGGGVGQLSADRGRQIPSIDPDGRLLVLSCGAALHHLGLGPTPAARPVPLRDFLAHQARTSVVPDPPPVGDQHASYAVLATAGDRPGDWLTAGEALSALLLTATAHGLSTSPMSDLVEVPASRALLRELLAEGHPALVVRIGVPASDPPATALAPRRRGPDVVHVADFPDHDGS
ncbi:nitroreductase family protein [Micromonospora sp. CA-263727]|uniref:nitroreductase family protein n=1 Tax=Micromonospora sp. CA-263727 TaxID=3239967 RepID=UPI003D8DF980